jgi:hypothetical protein
VSQPITAKRWTDNDVEMIFGLSVSKMRTAQKLKLTNSDRGLRDHKSVRTWDIYDVSKVYFADEFAFQVGIPFATTAELFSLTSSDDFWKELLGYCYEPKNFDPPKCRIINRDVVVGIQNSQHMILGYFEPRDQKPLSFKARRSVFDGNIEGLVEYEISTVCVEFAGICKKFSSVLHKAKLMVD